MQVKIYRLKYAEAEEVSDMINDLIGNAASSKNTKQSANPQSRAGGGANLTRGGQQQRPNQPQRPQSNNGSRAGELSKENVTVLADKRINGLVVMARTQDFPAIEQIIESMDVRLSQVLIETMILQIQLGDEFSTGIDWVAGLGSRSKGQRLTGGGGGTSINNPLLSSLLTNAVSGVSRGLHYTVVSKSLDLGAVINASKSDSRAKLVASPIIMTVDNKEATIKATKMRYLLKGYTYSGSTYNGSAVPDYEQKEIGLTVKVTPKINPNGTVMLSIEEEFSSLGEGQTIQAATGGTTSENGSTQQAISGIEVETTVTRQLTADITVEDRKTVILGGLTQTEKTESEGGIPFLKDIPWIGKYLFGSTTKKESRQELLMFLTPYVLDDADDAVAEARRRKKTLSDAKPWDDGGWSASPLADEIGLKEQLKRKQREWQQQDEEYKIKQKLDKATEKRVELLKKQAEKAEKERKAKEPKESKVEKKSTQANESNVKEVPVKKVEPVKENAR
jgi:type II secretion system protein D